MQNLQGKGKTITGFASADTSANAQLVNALSKVEPVGITYIKRTLEDMGITYVTEHRFNKARKFRFDLAIPERLWGIEYEGLFSEESRHLSFVGYTNDSTKYNLAASTGWRVLRYTAKNYHEFYNDLITLLAYDAKKIIQDK